MYPKRRGRRAADAPGRLRRLVRRALAGPACVMRHARACLAVASPVPWNPADQARSSPIW